MESGGHAEPGAGKAGRIMHVRGDNFVDTYPAMERHSRGTLAGYSKG